MSPGRRRRGMIVAVAFGTTGFGFVVILLAWLAMLAGAKATMGNCSSTEAVAAATPSASLATLFEEAAARYRLGARGPSVLAAIAEVESGFGQNMGPSSAGAIGFMQFEPATWAAYGVDADGDGRKDPYAPADAIFAAARYLRASGRTGGLGASGLRLQPLRLLRPDGPRQGRAATRASSRRRRTRPTRRARGSRRSPALRPASRGSRAAAHSAPIPGFPGMTVDERILPDAMALIAKYHLAVTAAYAPTGHEPDGEHPLGLGARPRPGHGWDMGRRRPARGMGRARSRTIRAPRSAGSATTATPATVAATTCTCPGLTARPVPDRGRPAGSRSLKSPGGRSGVARHGEQSPSQKEPQ